mgnify:CR=1 FL=1
MALDGIYLSLLRKEFDPLIDGRVDKIHQPSREELIMTIRTKEGAQKLMFSTGAGSARVHITTADIENPKTPDQTNPKTPAYVLYAHEKASCRGQTHCH